MKSRSSLNELLGSAQKAIELTQTGAIDFVVAGTCKPGDFREAFMRSSVCHICLIPRTFTSL